MVRRYARWLAAMLSAALLTLGPTVAQAALQATVDRNPVSVDESFTLTLQSDGNGGTPDLAPLQRDFEILGQSQGSSIQIINGRTSQSRQWQISLAPKRAGQIVIPPISVNGQSSQPITLGVTAGKQPGAGQATGNLFIDVSAEPRTAYVQQQIIFTVRFYRAVDLGNGSSLSDPVFPGMDAVVQRLGDDREFQTVRNGREYVAVERRYAVYAQKDGSFSSDPVVFNGSIIEAAPGGGFFGLDPFNQRSRRQRLSSRAVALTIKPVPTAFNGSQWLPTGKLQLSEQWTQNPPRFMVGEPVTRTLTLQASGLTASVLPAIDIDSNDAIKLYPDQPALKDNKNDNGISGTREQRFAIIPRRAGKLTLPAIEVKWWNTASDREEVARLPAREITVLPGVPGTSAQPPVSTNPATVPAQIGQAHTPPAASSQSSSAAWWPWLSLVLGLGWLITLIAWWRARSRSGAPSPGKSAKSKGHTATHGQIESQLKNSCLANDAPQVRSLLLAWARQRWPDDAPNNLTAMARRCAPPLGEALAELDRHLYAPGSIAWRGERLWELFQRHQPAKMAAVADESKLLEPLYKH